MLAAATESRKLGRKLAIMQSFSCQTGYMDSMTIRCRQATMDDLDDINVLQQSSAMGAPFSKRQEIVYKRLIDEPMSDLLVIEKDLYVVGLCQLTIIPTLHDGGRPQALIDHILIDPLNRRQGLSRQLLQAAVQYARKAGCYRILFVYPQAKPWQKQYLSSLGFVDSGGCFLIS